MKLLTHTEIKLTLAILILAQLVFASISGPFTTPSYEGRIYATTGVMHKQEDLHKLNEAAHYFGQTIIGWLKFPNFMNDLSSDVSLPEDATISAHIQERQNIIFTLSSAEPIEEPMLTGTKDFIQSKLDSYNSLSRTEFVLSNLDYETLVVQKSYSFGALVTLIASLVITLGLIFIIREF